MKFAIFGAGAVGSYFGGLLSLAGHNVSLVARGSHLEAIRRNGLILMSMNGDHFEEETINIFATDDPAEIGPVDYIIFGVKAFDTLKGGRQLEPLVGNKTAVVTVQNGLDSPIQLAALYGRDKVMAGAARIEITLGEPGVVIKKGPLRVGCVFEVAELTGAITERLQRLVEAYKEIGVNASLSTEPQYVLWNKFLRLAPTAALLASARAHGGEVFTHQLTLDLMSKLVDEMVAIAGAEGIKCSPEVIERARGPLFPVETAFKSSLQRDFEKGRHTEVEELVGAVVRRGIKYNVPTPHFNTLYALLSLAAKVGYRFAN